MSPSVAIDRVELASFCRRHAIRRLAVFGSALRDDFGPHSDIDVGGRGEARKSGPTSTRASWRARDQDARLVFWACSASRSR